MHSPFLSNERALFYGSISGTLGPWVDVDVMHVTLPLHSAKRYQKSDGPPEKEPHESLMNCQLTRLVICQ